MKSKLDGDEIARQAAAIAQHFQRIGIQWLPKPRQDTVESMGGLFAKSIVADAEPASDRISDRPVPERSTPTGSDRPTAPTGLMKEAYASQPLAVEQRSDAIELIDQEVQSCVRCEILSSCRKNTVFGEGSPSARFVFFGEGPGAEEDQSGRPFVGRAGQLLTKMIEACTLKREEVYIMNTVKCRPPGNRNPEPDELQNCREFYQRQLEIIQPEYIICLGAVSAQELLQNKTSVGKMRGRFHRYFASKVLVTYHPAYLLRTPAAKKAAWEDLQLMMRDAGL